MMIDKKQVKKEFAEVAKKILPKDHQGAKIILNISADGGISTIEVNNTYR